MTTADPITHRATASLPRHACPDLTCRPGEYTLTTNLDDINIVSSATFLYT
jgi:hypothetical protein